MPVLLRNLNCMSKTVLTSLLNRKINGQFNVAARFCRHGTGTTGHCTCSIHLNSLLAANALKQALVLQLDAGLANDIARFIGNRSSTFVLIIILLFELFARNGTRISKQMTGKRSIRVVTLGALDDLDIIEKRGMFLNIRNRGSTNIRSNGMQALSALVIVLDIALDGDIGHTEHICKMPNGDGIFGKRAIRGNGQARTIGDKRRTVSVENTTARSGRRYRTGLILI